MQDWDRESMTALRGALYRRDGAAALALFAERPLRPTLQYAGDALTLALTQDTAGARDRAAECVTELAARDWPGDAELAHRLTTILGGAEDTLTEVPVDLGELGAFLDGAPGPDVYVLDLHKGEVLPVGELNGEYTDEIDPAFDEESPQYEPTRWLEFWPLGHPAETDRADFTETLPDETLRTRLFRILDRPDGIRLFRSALAGTPDEHDWLIFAEERSRGRARHWLATRGLRPC
ncbi:hypothetical protein DPM19_07700 [Actinomadura craniellae]|uniref:Uncharacterized protein n=1 Tax=Actinomadura craniellae TaxID=2231787 RepID=A0A365HBM1_9ACTN|nr:hypothetical protein [Actinomadura craniellae]RAY15663.1 hypothetical protein DPM19_07700 [Actinomadura craniellae]